MHNQQIGASEKTSLENNYQQNLQAKSPLSKEAQSVIKIADQVGIIALDPTKQVESLAIPVANLRLSEAKPASFSPNAIQKILQGVKTAQIWIKELFVGGFNRLSAFITGHFDLPELIPLDQGTQSQGLGAPTLSANTLSLKEKTLPLLQQALIERNREKFIEVLSSLKVQGEHELAAELIEKLLINYADAAKVDEETSQYQMILNSVAAVYPQTKEYFTDPVTTGLPPVKLRGLNSTLLKDQSVEFILDHLKEKGIFNTVSCRFCPTFKEMTKTVETFLQHTKDQPGPIKAIFLTRHLESTNDEANGPHITPFYIEKTKDGEYRVIITDSTGVYEDYSNTLAETLTTAFKTQLPEAKLLLAQCGTKRQHDDTNCIVFSIRDAVQFAKHSDAIVEWTLLNKANLKLSYPNSHFPTFTSLPPQMMRMAQSLSLIQTYENDHKFYANLRSKHRLLNADGKEFNAKTAAMYLKYERMILAHIIRQGVLEPKLNET